MPGRFVRRRFSRILFAAPACLHADDENSWLCHIVDISLNGVLISRPDPWQGYLQQPYVVNINLPDSDVQLEMALELAHINEKVIGFCCVAVLGESRVHLQRLVELNLGDPNLLYRELAELSQD